MSSCKSFHEKISASSVSDFLLDVKERHVMAALGRDVPLGAILH